VVDEEGTMMRELVRMKAAAVVVLAMLGCGAGVSQTGQGAQTSAAGSASQAGMTDSQTLQAILVEMRGIHNDVRLSQTTQILLTEMEVQRGIVDKAMEKRDNARTRLSQMQMNEKNFAIQIAQNEDAAKATLDAVQQQRLADQLQMLKRNMANFKSQEEDAVSAQQDAESALRKEQDTLQVIQDQLNEVVKKLQPVEK
jgi:hypothetical protein